MYIRDGRTPIPKNEHTSRVMSANKGKNTLPELILRKALYNKGFKGYRLNNKKLVGKPDITYGRYKIAIFVNGCFWHRCPDCNLPLPKSNTEFWNAKFQRNIKRDKEKYNILTSIGWNVLVVWECQIKKDIFGVVDKLKHYFQLLRENNE